MYARAGKAFDSLCERVDGLEALIGEQGPAGGRSLPKAGGTAADKINIEAAWMAFRMLLLEVKREVGNRKVTTTMAAKMVAARMRRKIRGQSLLGVAASAKAKEE